MNASLGSDRFHGLSDYIFFGLTLFTVFWSPAKRRANSFGGIRPHVCLYVCITITLESVDVESGFSVCESVLTGYGLSSYVKVIRSRSRSQKPIKLRNSLFPRCKTLIGSNSSSVEDSREVCVSMWFSATTFQSNDVTAIFVTWPEMTTPN